MTSWKLCMFDLWQFMNVTLYNIYTERQKKLHFFRVSLTEIQSINMNHIWTQITVGKFILNKHI